MKKPPRFRWPKELQGTDEELADFPMIRLARAAYIDGWNAALRAMGRGRGK